MIFSLLERLSEVSRVSPARPSSVIVLIAREVERSEPNEASYDSVGQ